MKYMSHLLEIQNVRILLHEKITGFIQLNLRTMFRHNLLYFASLIIFMDRLYLDNDFRTLYLSFYYFYSCCCCFVVVVVLLLFLLLVLLFYYYFHYICSLCLLLCFVALLGIIFLSYSAFQLFMLAAYGEHFVIFNICSFAIVLDTIFLPIYSFTFKISRKYYYHDYFFVNISVKQRKKHF